MRKPSLLLYALCCCLYAQTQRALQPVAAVPIRCGAYAEAQTDVLSATANQAALAQIRKPSAGIYAEKRFMLQELSFFQLATALPAASGSFGLNATCLGSPQANELQAGLAYGRSLGEKLSLGVQFNYFTMGISGYGRASTVNFEGGLLYRCNKQLVVGAHVYNPTQSRIGKSEADKLAAVYSLGLGYEPSDAFSLSGSVEKSKGAPLDVQTSLQYLFCARLLARAGISTGTSVYFLGAGVVWKDFRLDALASVHPQLGLSPGLMVIFKNFEKQ